MAIAPLSRQNQLPTSSQPIATFGNSDVPTIVTTEWYKFFANLSALLKNLVDGVLGFTVQSGATAAGASQATALLMTTEWIEVTVTPPGAGVLMVGFGAGVPETVFNEGANSLSVYPPVGSRIDALAINAPYVLASGKMQTFYQTRTNQFRSTQLG